MTQFRVRIIKEAESDLAELTAYIAQRDSLHQAQYVLDKLLETCERLEQNPERGRFLPELLPLGIKEFREVHFKPYRIIYQVIRREVSIHLIVDGRRSLQSLLEQRLLR